MADVAHRRSNGWASMHERASIDKIMAEYFRDETQPSKSHVRMQTAMEVGRLLWPDLIDEALQVHVTTIVDEEIEKQRIITTFTPLILDHVVGALAAAMTTWDIAAKPTLSSRETQELWAGIETMLSKTAAITRCIFPDKKQHKRRGEILQNDLLRAPNDYLHLVRKMRNVVEHFDEHLAAAVASGDVQDRVLLGRTEIVPGAYIIRSLDMHSQVLSIKGFQLHMFKLVEALNDMLIPLERNQGPMRYSAPGSVTVLSLI